MYNIFAIIFYVVFSFFEIIFDFSLDNVTFKCYIYVNSLSYNRIPAD